VSASVILIDDHVLFAEALGPMLDTAGLRVVGIASDPDQGVRLAEEHQPDLALVDLVLGELDGFDVAERIRLVSPQTRSVIVSALDDSDSVAEALGRGLHGYLTKEMPVSAIVAGLRAVLDGQVVLPPRVMQARRATLPRSDDVRLLVEQLTPREWEVLQLLVEGVGSPDISSRLGISPNTVRTHVQGILTKLQVHSRLEAATFAVHHGLFEPDPDSVLSRPA